MLDTKREGMIEAQKYIPSVGGIQFNDAPMEGGPSVLVSIAPSPLTCRTTREWGYKGIRDGLDSTRRHFRDSTA